MGLFIGSGSVLSGASVGSTLAMSAGGLVVGGLLGAATTHTDGTRDVHRRYANDYQLQPTSQDAARKSIHFQRVMSGIGLVAGTAMAGFGLLKGRIDPGLAIAGSAVVGGSAARLMRLSGAEDHLSKALPEHTAPGQAEMRRRNIMGWASDGAGYSAGGWYQGPWIGRGAIADGVESPFGYPTGQVQAPRTAVVPQLLPQHQWGVEPGAIQLPQGWTAPEYAPAS
jgi:hypothetical protein